MATGIGHVGHVPMAACHSWLFLTILAYVTPAQATVLNVPGDYPTIQNALLSSVRGDTVLVASGIYAEQLTINTPFITFLSQSLGGAHIRVQAPVILVPADSAKIHGFQIEATSYTAGNAGIRFDGSPFALDSCTITGGWAGVIVSAVGTIRGTAINLAQQGVLVSGIGSSVVIDDCEIVDNASTATGGGIGLLDGTSAVVSNCQLIGNSAGVSGGAAYVEPLAGGGPSHLVMTGCLIYGNSAPIGAALRSVDSELTIRSCTIVGNSAGNLGAVIDLEDFLLPQQVDISQTIVAFNDGRAFGCFQAAMPLISCTDVFGNSNDSICGTNGGDNTMLDPLFCNRLQLNFDLQEGSPCAPSNSPPGCGLIGALPTSCVSPVRASTWG